MIEQWRAAGLRFVCQRITGAGTGLTESRWWDAAGNGYGFAAAPDPARPDSVTILTITNAPTIPWQTC